MKFVTDSHHPLIHMKKAGRFWSVRIGLHYHTVAVEVPGGLLCGSGSAAMKTKIN